DEIFRNTLYMPDKKATAQAREYLDDLMKQGNSAGGVVECRVSGLPAGLGETVFDKLDAELAKAVMSIGAVKAVELGSGVAASHSTGKENNDEFFMEDGQVRKATNNSGGVLGGMSDGSELILRASFKPTPSISALQHTVNKSGEDIEVSIKGRHDPIIVPRAVIVVRSMMAIVLVDMILRNMTARMDRIENFYRR
ncbi:MAG: chorismate synthase, partial [Oscillospiraceae bacterium]|nr:chorismate synthase [Oscillospiraceae bacterium]